MLLFFFLIPKSKEFWNIHMILDVSRQNPLSYFIYFVYKDAYHWSVFLYINWIIEDSEDVQYFLSEFPQW